MGTSTANRADRLGSSTRRAGPNELPTAELSRQSDTAARISRAKTSQLTVPSGARASASPCGTAASAAADSKLRDRGGVQEAPGFQQSASLFQHCISLPGHDSLFGGKEKRPEKMRGHISRSRAGEVKLGTYSRSMLCVVRSSDRQPTGTCDKPLCLPDDCCQRPQRPPRWPNYPTANRGLSPAREAVLRPSAT